MDDFYSQRDLPSEPLQTNSDLITSAPLIYENDYVLVVATKTHIKLFSLLDKISEIYLPEPPLKILPYVFGGNQAIAVAFSNFVAVYECFDEELRESARYNLQYPPTSKEESEIFRKFIDYEATSSATASALKELMYTQTLSDLAQQFISLPDPPAGEPQSPYQQRFYGTINRSRLLDGFTHYKDEITAFSVIDSSDNSLKTFTGQCLVVGTKYNLFQIIKSDLSGPLLTLFLDRYSTPQSIYMEGVIAQYGADAGEMKISHVAVQKNDATNYSWRATVLTAYGVVLSIRNGQVSANRIETDSIPAACYRINKSVFLVLNSPYPASVYKLSVRGRIEMQYELYDEYRQLLPVEIVLGKPFSGFAVLMRQNRIIFMGENGPARYMQLYNKYPIESIQICRLSTSDTALICVFSNGGVAYKLLKKNADLSVQRGVSTHEYPAKPFDVESIDSNDSRFKPFPLDVQQRLAKEFLPARAAARNVVLYELLSNAERGIDTQKNLEFQANAILEGSGPVFQLVVSVKNIGKQVVAQMSCSVFSSVLRADREIAVVPSLPIGGEVELTFVLSLDSTGSGNTIESHEIAVEIGDDGQRALWTGTVCIPEFIC